MDEAAVRAALTELSADDGAPLLAPDDVTGVVIEDGWLAVHVAKEGASAPFLARVHRHLRSAFPDAEVEVRANGRVYCGGAGFGEGRHVVAVLGGKGGVGKSTLAVNLALTLSAMGLSVGLLDGDLNAPDIPHLLGIRPKHPIRGAGLRVLADKLTPPSRRQRPQERFGLEVTSVGFLVPEQMPPVIGSRGLVSTLLRSFIFDIVWSADVRLSDAPPGTGEELQVLARELPLSGAVFVTTPQDLAQMDAERTLALLAEHDLPVIGIVYNMASLTCPHCAQEIDMFQQSTRLAAIDVLGRIPFDVRLSVTADQGLPLVLGDPRGEIALEFARIGHAVRRWLHAPAGASPEPR